MEAKETILLMSVENCMAKVEMIHSPLMTVHPRSMEELEMTHLSLKMIIIATHLEFYSTEGRDTMYSKDPTLLHI